MPLIDGKKIAKNILSKTKREVKLLKEKNIHPMLGVILVGDHEPSKVYVAKKQEAAENIGIGFKLFSFEKTISEQKLISEIQKIQKKYPLSGLIVQLPLPEHLYTPTILNSVDASKDVDSLTSFNIGKLMMKWGNILPPTPAAALEILRSLKVSLPGKDIVIVGAGALVGKPLSIILANERATVTLCNSATKNLQSLCKKADIIVSGVGKKDLIRGNMVKSGAIVIDAGVSFENKKMYGDANVSEISKKAFVTPTPGGVGPITVAKLLANTVICAKNPE